MFKILLQLAWAVHAWCVCETRAQSVRACQGVAARIAGRGPAGDSLLRGVAVLQCNMQLEDDLKGYQAYHHRPFCLSH